MLNLAQVDNVSPSTARIVRSLLEGETEWEGVGKTPTENSVLKERGGLYFSMSDGSRGFQTS